MKPQYYLYGVCIIIFLIIMSAIKQEEGFKPVWYKDEYFIMPLGITLFIVGPVIYIIYGLVFRNINKALQ